MSPFCSFRHLCLLQHYVKALGERAVINLNVDMAFSGNTSIRGLGVPLVYDAMYDVAKRVSHHLP